MELPIVELAEGVETKIPLSAIPEPKVVAVTGLLTTKIPLPVIPLYELKLAAPLIPCSVGGLQAYLSAHKANHPAVYRRERSGRRIRLISAHEIIAIRADMLKGPGLDRVLVMYPDEHNQPTLSPT